MKKLWNRTVTVFVVLTLLLSIAPLCVPVQAAVRNVTDNSTVPGWSVEIANVDGGVLIDDQEQASGQNSMKLYNNTVKTSDTTFLRASYPVSVKKGKSYTYGFKVKVKNAQSVTSQMNWITPRSNLLPTGGTAGWRELEFNYNHAGNDGTAYIRIILDTRTEAVWIDDVYFYESSGGIKVGENLVSNPSFEDTPATMTAEKEQDAAEAKTDREIIPVSYTDAITVDGNLADWAGIEPIPMTKKSQWVEGDISLTANIRYAYDDENMYFAIDAIDDIHYPILEGSYWDGDGLQFAICSTNETFGVEYAYVKDIVTGEERKEGPENLQCAFRRNGTSSVYEVAIPWDDYFPKGKPEAMLFCVIINENDNDGRGRRYCLETAPGIAYTKNSAQYPLMLLMKNDRTFSGWLSGPTDCYAGDDTVYALSLVNSTDKDLKLNLHSDQVGLDETVTVPANGTLAHGFAAKYDTMGPVALTVDISDGTDTLTLETETDIYANAEMTQEVIARQKGHLKELAELVNQCRQANITIDYEMINYYVVERFIQYLEEALSKNDLVRVYHQDQSLTRIYSGTKEKLEQYLNGEATPVPGTKYITSDINVVGKHFEATTDTNGVQEVRPVFFVGAGHWAPSRRDIPYMQNFGFNAIQPEVGAWSFMYRAHSVKDWRFSTEGTFKVTDEAVTDDVHGDETALKLTCSDAYKMNNYVYFYQTVTVKPNTTYKYGIWAKSNSSQYAWFTVNDRGNVSNRKSLNGTYDWKELTFEQTTGPEQTSMTFTVVVENATNGLWLDDAYIMESGSEENLLDNSGFEKTNSPDQYWEIRPSAIESLERDLDLCAQYNLSAVYSTAPHYLPAFYKAEFPEMMSHQTEGYIPFLPDHEKYLEAAEIYYRTLLPRIKDKPAFDSVILMNEPVFSSFREEFYQPIFQDYLKEKYGDIESLNQRWNTEYDDFTEVVMPTSVEPTPRFYDWRVFNDSIVPHYNEVITELIREYAPDVLTQTKVMMTTETVLNGRILASNNLEALAESLDINGCDAWSYYGAAGSDISVQTTLYDLQQSIKSVPCYNTEDHIIRDGRTMIYSAEELQFNLATLWQTAVHGKCGSVIWTWDRESRTAGGGALHNPLLTERPDHVAGIGKMTLDLNRLSKEVAAIMEEQAKVGILYTLNSIPYSRDMLDTIYNTYTRLGENGQRVQFIVESQPERVSEVEVLVVPHAISVTDETFAAIRSFAENGGRVIVMGADSLSRNEYGDVRSQAELDALLQHAEVIEIVANGSQINGESAARVAQTVARMVEEQGYNTITVIDKATGEPLEDFEYLYTEYEGKYVVNICTYRDDDVEAELYVNGKLVTESVDLIEQESYGSTVALPAYTPLLLSIGK